MEVKVTKVMEAKEMMEVMEVMEVKVVKVMEVGVTPGPGLCDHQDHQHPGVHGRAGGHSREVNSSSSVGFSVA